MNDKTQSVTLKQNINEEIADVALDKLKAELPATKPIAKAQSNVKQTKEVGGPKGLEPTRYGDWESKGRCYDF